MIAGNKIGTDVTGAVALGNAGDGVNVQSSSGNTIGGSGAVEADIISANGNPNYGDRLRHPAFERVRYPGRGKHHRHRSDRNDGFGQWTGGRRNRCRPRYGATDNTIGGTTASAGNLITDNDAAGVVVTDNGGLGNDMAVGNQITANRIFGNTGQAIDLDDDGVTENSTVPRLGANMLQNFPIIVTTASGQLLGWLGYSLPDASYRIDLYASAAYGPGGSGEAEDFLGSLEVTTNSRGDAIFDVPFAPPAGLPIVTATATDPQGDTSEVSALRQATLQAPSSSVLAVANQASAITAKPADAIAILDPDAGPLDPAWRLALSVSNGSLSLPAIAGLTGSGDGTASLSYSGGLLAVNEALEGLDLHSARRAPCTGYSFHLRDIRWRGFTRDWSRGNHDSIRRHRRCPCGRHDSRQRPRLAPPGDPGCQHRHWPDRNDRFRHPRFRRPDDRARKSPAGDRGFRVD